MGWLTIKDQFASTIKGGSDVAVHYHPGDAFDSDVDLADYYPGPNDTEAPAKGIVSFILTPDKNTLVNVGVKNGRYFAHPVWQRPGTRLHPGVDYSAWKPTGKDLQ